MSVFEENLKKKYPEPSFLGGLLYTRHIKAIKAYGIFIYMLAIIYISTIYQNINIRAIFIIWSMINVGIQKGPESIYGQVDVSFSDGPPSRADSSILILLLRAIRFNTVNSTEVM